MKNIIAGTLLYIVISFAAQSLSHFVINAEHYASISFMRGEPIFILGFITMILQGIVLSYLFVNYSNKKYTLRNGLIFGCLMAAFFVSYPALVEPAKYNVPSIGSWIMVEGIVGSIQFISFGILLTLIFNKINTNAKVSI